MATQDVTIPNMLQQLYQAKLYLITVIMFDLTEIDKSWSEGSEVLNISKFSEKIFLISSWLSCLLSFDFIKAGVIYSPGFIVNINRDIKMNIRAIFHNLISLQVTGKLEFYIIS